MDKQLSKEETLSKITGEEGIYLTHGMIRGSDALEAMDTYAKQECMGLIEFMYASCAETIPNSRPAKWRIDINTEVTFEQLYELYQQSK